MSAKQRSVIVTGAWQAIGAVEQLGVIGGALLLSGLLAGCALQGGLGTSGSREDAEIAANFETAQRQHPDLSLPNDIHAATHNRVVYLSGFVATPLQSENAAELARDISGVSSVVNSVAVNQ
jgi:hypothetical protein